jgi:starch phosphorylase
MFRQEIFQGWQAEIPDNWLSRGNPWEIPRFDVKYTVNFYGSVTSYTDEEGTHVSYKV